MIHPSADIQSENIGEGTKIWQFSVILKGAVIGSDCNINCHTFIENDVVIGNYVTIKSGVYIWDGIRIGNNVFVGPNVTFVNNPYVRSQKYPAKHVGANIKNGASIGANATIMGDITIGEYAFIGAGSVLTKSVPPYQLWYGNPARHQGYVDEEGKIISLNLTDKNGMRYRYIDNKLIKET